MIRWLGETSNSSSGISPPKTPALILTGRSSGRRYRLGDPVEVRLIAADPISGRLELQLMGGGGAATQRKLIFPDELRRLDDDLQLVLIENANPIMGQKIRWFEDPDLADKGVNLHAN